MRTLHAVLLFLVAVFALTTGPAGVAAEAGGASGIWHAAEESSANAPEGKWYFRRHFVVAGDGPIRSATCSITADNAFVVFVNGKKLGAGNNWQNVYRFDAKALLSPGDNVLAVEGANWKGSGENPAALFVGLRVNPSGAQAVEVYSDTRWKSSAVETRGWQNVDFDDSAWQAASAVTWNGWENAKLVEQIAAATHIDPAKLTVEKLALAKKTLALVERHARRPQLAAELSSLSKRVERAAERHLFTDALYDEACSLRRRIIFSHPLLDFDRLLINKRPPPSYSHMSRQYLGRYSRVGPGLAVLESWKEDPREQLLLKGKLPAGSVLHPDLSFDAKRVLFSFCDHTQQDPNLRRFVLYEVGVDGSGLRQITGRPDDMLVREEGLTTTLIEDWDPCYLPDGGIAFVSTRLQAHIRCQYGGRYFANFVLYRADRNGSNIRRLSFNEACEWEPALLDDGRLVYTRWDYVNRHFSYFQGLWVTRPDGAATALVYKMYSRNPCMTGEPRSIPGSHKIVSTAMAHHGYTAGSIIAIDPQQGQEGEAPITRLTPEISFPETETWPVGGAYCNPYPLSEDLFLVAYTPDPLAGEGRIQREAAYGIYLLDSLGGRELIYRDPTMSCFAPIPLRPRPKPPVLPSLVESSLAETTGAFYVDDVYRSTQTIPRRSVKSLRVVRMYAQPIETPPSRGKAIIDMPKRILGTVPVDENGRVAFRAPAGQPLLFQLLDDQGMSVMSMRSAVYLQPGEVSGCAGCHEPRHSTTRRVAVPNDVTVHELTPPVGPQYEGGLSFARTVQPVLDRYCIQCHGLDKTEGDVNLLGRIKDVTFAYPAWPGPNRMIVSDAYESLVNQPGLVSIAQCNFENDYTTPKDYFAHAGTLAHMLLAGHADEDGKARVKLDRESFQRVVDWLDMNAICYGDYSWNKVEWRKASPPDEAALRQHIRNTFSEKLAQQPFDALVNVAEPPESRILKGPLANSAGGWGQITQGGWRNTEERGYRKMRQLVEASIAPLKFHDVAGTCGHDQCVCGTCWVRHAEQQRLEQTTGDKSESASVSATSPVPDVSGLRQTPGGIAGSE
ncbi:MAG: hypothetical protein HQ567_15020 [Candidatus Nealsonbacteria bacterium]|nr:hypothetical protein [Candidatus Nealsonbacteria bacterium]